MKLDPVAIEARADRIYAEKTAVDNPYTAPECLPTGLRSNQVRAVIEAICEAINEQDDD